MYKQRNELPFKVTFGNIENNTNSRTKNIISFFDLQSLAATKHF
jgi:hypothetical protein